METTQAVTSGGSAAPATIASGSPAAAPETAPMVLAPSSADAAAPQDAPKLSRSQKTAAAKAVQSARAPTAAAPPRPVLADHVPAGIELSPAAAALKPGEIAAAFMGKATDAKGETTPTETPPPETPETPGAEGAETETETPAGETPAETETETPAAETTATPLDGITAALSKHPELKGLTKRITEVFKQNSERAETIKQLEAKPATVLPPSATDPLSHAATPAAVDDAVTSAKTEARSRLRWLNRHLDGGLWLEGTEQQQELNAAQVDSAIEYYESVADGMDKQGAARKDYLSRYAETVKTLEIPATDLVNPTVPTRESQLIRAVPEIMKTPDYLQILADAKAWREIREKKAKGVQFVEIDPAKGKPTTPPAVVPAKPANSSSTLAKVRTPPASAEAAMTLDQLREKRDQGSRTAQVEINRRFLQAA